MTEEKYIQTRWMELVVAFCFMAVGAVVISDSVRVGAGWADDGPQAGYFPFYIGCILVACAAVVIAQTLMGWRQALSKAQVFVQWAELKLVLAMLLPTLLFVLGVVFMGIYESSVIFIAAFMIWQGKYAVWKAGAVSLGVMAVVFLLFEVWFLVPLPKGPLERLLGY